MNDELSRIGGGGMPATLKYLKGTSYCSAGARCRDTSVKTAKCCSAVDPPGDLMVLDPGFLGYLKIVWNPPASLTNATECPKLYQLEYFDTYSGRWSVRVKLSSMLLNAPPVLITCTACVE